MYLKEYIINKRVFTQLATFGEEFNLKKNKNYLFPLSYLSSLRLRGDQAGKFLQGQLSCDIRQVSSTTIRQGALCNLKGRILALMDVIDWQGLQLILPEDLLADTQISLSKTAQLSRVNLEPSSEYQFYGFYLQNPDDLLPSISLPSENFSLTASKETCCCRLSATMYLIIIENQQATVLSEPFFARGQLHGSLAWHQLQLQQKQVLIYPETRGMFLPHRLDLHLSGHLSFDKGCYKGQEIIARTHYRAKLKHSLQLFTLDTKEPLYPGKKLLDPTGKIEVGELIDYCPLNDEHQLIAASVIHEPAPTILIEDHQAVVNLKKWSRNNHP